jgi:hypothetical protein
MELMRKGASAHHRMRVAASQTARRELPVRMRMPGRQKGNGMWASKIARPPAVSRAGQRSRLERSNAANRIPLGHQMEYRPRLALAISKLKTAATNTVRKTNKPSLKTDGVCSTEDGGQ